MSHEPTFNRGQVEEEIRRWTDFLTYSRRLLHGLPQRPPVARDLERLCVSVTQYVQELEAAKEHLAE